MINSINKALLWLGVITTALWLFLAGFNLGPFALVFPALAITWWRFILWDSKNKNWFVKGAKENEAVWAVKGEEVPVRPIFTSQGKKYKRTGDVLNAPGKDPGIMNGHGIFGSGIYFLPNFGVIGGVHILKSTMAWLEYEQKGKEFDLIDRKEETQYVFTKVGNYAVPLLNVEDKEKIQVDFILGIPGKFVNVRKPVFLQDEPFARIQNIIQSAVIDYAFANLNFDFMVNTDDTKEVKGDRKTIFQEVLGAVSGVKQKLLDEVGFEMNDPLILDFDLSGDLGKQLYEKITEVEKVRLDAKIKITNAKGDADAKEHEARGIETIANANAKKIKVEGEETNKILKKRREELGEFAFGMHEFNEGMSNFGGEALSINIGSDAKSNLQFVKPIGGGGGNKGGGNTPPKKTKQIKQKN